MGHEAIVVFAHDVNNVKTTFAVPLIVGHDLYHGNYEWRPCLQCSCKIHR